MLLFFVTRLSGLLVCILWSFFLFCLLLFCFELCLFFSFFFIHLKKKTPKKTGHSKNPKKQKCRKTGQKTVSVVVFTNSVLQFFGLGLKFWLLAENTIKLVVSAFFQTGKNTPKLAKTLSQNLVQGWVKTWSKCVAQHNWTKFWLKEMCVF